MPTYWNIPAFILDQQEKWCWVLVVIRATRVFSHDLGDAIYNLNMFLAPKTSGLHRETYQHYRLKTLSLENLSLDKGAPITCATIDCTQLAYILEHTSIHTSSVGNWCWVLVVIRATRIFSHELGDAI